MTACADLLAILRLRLARRRIGAVLRALLRLLQPPLHGRMEPARLDDLGQALHRHASPCAGEIAVEVVLEAHARARTLRRRTSSRPSTRRGIDDGRAGAPQVLDRAPEHAAPSPDRSVSRSYAWRSTPMRAPLQSVASQGRRRSSAADVRARGRGGRIVGILADDHLEHRAASSTVRAIGPAMSASRLSGITPARLVSPIVERMPDQRLVRRGPADGVAGVAAQADRAEAGRDRRRGAAARPRRDAIERVRVLRVAGQDRAHRLVRA